MTAARLSMKESEERFAAAEAQLATVMGVVNAAFGSMIDEVAYALDTGLWEVWGIHSPAHWLAWQSGTGQGRAADLVRIAERREELPCAVAALRSGVLSVEAVIEIAKRAPAAYEESITEFAKVATIAQLRKSLRDYAYDPDTEKAKPKPREDTRSVTSGTDANGWWSKTRLPADEGAVVEKAMQAARDDLYAQARAEQPEGEDPPRMSLADGLVGVAESFLRAGQAAHPGSDRYLIHLHLDGHPHPNDNPDRDGNPDGDGNGDGSGSGSVLSFHLGAAVPAGLRAMMLCDAAMAATWWGEGAPISVGRKTRVISDKLRRTIEHRDGGCVIPGCGRRVGLEIHHLIHWEHAGPTNTSNLVALCRAHHRAHHQDQLAITGNADLPAGTTGALTFTDPFGRHMPPAGTPTPPKPGTSFTHAAQDAGIAPTAAFEHPLGERLDYSALFFHQTNPPPEPRPPKDHDPGGANGPHGPRPSNRAENTRPDGQQGDAGGSGPPTDPRHGGPPTTNSPPQN